MLYLILRVTEKILIIYFSLYLLIDFGLYLYSLLVFGKKKSPHKQEDPVFVTHPISLIVPAYNEEVSIVDCVRMLMQIDYPNYEVLIVNDGSRDGTLRALQEAFALRPVQTEARGNLKTKSIRGHYAGSNAMLTVIDKENGGKADSINAAINYARGDYICTIDADSILDRDALKAVVRPFILDPETMVTGGQLAASNEVVLKDNRVVSSKIPSNIWVLWQISEYLKSFMVSRIGLSRINALLIMSGAFSLYRKDELQEAGGFLTAHNDHPFIQKSIGLGWQTVCEDMEIVVRLFRYRKEQGKKARAVFLPEPTCWTEVPENGRNLFRQRSRWHQGLCETLKIHRDMIFEPRYGTVGLLGLPYYFLFEMMAPAIKVGTLVFLFLSALLGTLNYQWVLLLLLSVMLLTAIIISSVTAIIEYWSYAHRQTNRDALRYKGFRDWLMLVSVGILGEFSYAFFKIFAQLDGLTNFFKHKNEWRKFERKGVKTV